MHEHFSFLNQFFNVSDPILQKLYTAVGLVVVVLSVAYYAHKKVSTAEKRQQYIVPKRFSVVSLFDYFVEAFVSYQDGILGPENRKYAPFTGSVFLFLLLSNILGLIPGMAAITTTVVINLAVAIVAFLYFNYQGVKVNGLCGYLKHFAGPVIGLAPLIFCIEIFSTSLRVLTLNLRLYWNISADHLLMAAFMGLHPVLGVITYFIGFFVAFIQAFVFTTLTMVYIQLAVQHSEEE